MVEQVEKVGPKAETLTLSQLESLSEGEVHVLLGWSHNAVAGSVAVAAGIAGRAVSQRYDRVWRIGCGVRPVREPRLDATGGCGVGTTEARGESRSREIRAAQSVSASASRIDRRKGQAALQGEHAADFPSAERAAGKAVGMRKERQLVDRAGDEALPAIEIRETPRVACIILIVEAGIKSHRGRRNIVDRFGKGVGALPIQPLFETVREGRLQ